jgi:hypothetical protein
MGNHCIMQDVLCMTVSIDVTIRKLGISGKRLDDGWMVGLCGLNYWRMGKVGRRGRGSASAQ